MISSVTLGRFSLFAGLDSTFLGELSLISQDKTAEKADWLFHEGDKAEALYLIVHGSVELKLNLDRKRNIYATLTVLSEGDVLGWSAMVEPYVYSLGAMAGDHTQLVRFEGDSLRALLEKHPEQATILMQVIVQAMASRLNTLTERAPDLSLRLIISSSLFGLGIVTGILVVVLGIFALVSTINGGIRAGETILVTLFCLMFPAVFLFLASLIRPARFRDVSLGEVQNDSAT